MATAQIRPLQSTTSSHLSRPEVQALTLMANGASQKAAAQEMDISQRTYRRLLTDAATKLSANGPVHALCLAISIGLIVPTKTGLQFRPDPYKCPLR